MIALIVRIYVLEGDHNHGALVHKLYLINIFNLTLILTEISNVKYTCHMYRVDQSALSTRWNDTHRYTQFLVKAEEYHNLDPNALKVVPFATARHLHW